LRSGFVRLIISCAVGPGVAPTLAYSPRRIAYRWIEARAQPLRGADGKVVQWYFASIDIEDEMNAQEALRARASYGNLLRHFPR